MVWDWWTMPLSHIWLFLYQSIMMTAVMVIDNCIECDKQLFGWCVIEQCSKMAAPSSEGGGWYYISTNNYWVMWREADEWFPYGKFSTLQKAKTRLKQLEANDTFDQ